MKTILILCTYLFFSVNSKGQDVIVKWSHKDTVNITINDHTGVLKVMGFLWRDYSKSCYRDSTVVCMRRYTDGRVMSCETASQIRAIGDYVQWSKIERKRPRVEEFFNILTGIHEIK